MHSDDEEIGRSLEEMMASAAPPSSFPSLIQNSFVPSIDTNLSLLDFESKFRDPRTARLKIVLGPNHSVRMALVRESLIEGFNSKLEDTFSLLIF